MYLSIWLGILLGSTSCSSTNDKPSANELAEARRALPAEDAVLQDNPLARRLNKPSTMPSTPPAGARLSYSSVNIKESVVAMTFDDGPHPSLTPKLLDVFLGSVPVDQGLQEAQDLGNSAMSN